MAKKVARPARISVKKYEFLRSNRYFDISYRSIASFLPMATYMTGALQVEVPPHGAVSDCCISSLYPAHLL